MMNFPAQQFGGGFMPSQTYPSTRYGDYSSFGLGSPTASQAIEWLTPGLYRAAAELRAITGATPEAVLANLLGSVSFAVSGGYRVRAHNGQTMPLSLHIQFAGPPLSGKSAAHDRLIKPIVEAMRDWKKAWQFADIQPSTLLRKIRGGSVFALLSMAEGQRYLRGKLSLAFEDLNDLYDGHMPAFNRADDHESEWNAPQSAVLVVCVNAQSEPLRAWLERYVKPAAESGYLYRQLILTTLQTATDGVGSRQPASELVRHDRRIRELILISLSSLGTIQANCLPTIEMRPCAEAVLHKSLAGFRSMASEVAPRYDAEVFAVRLAANMRRIAACLHVYEGYAHSISSETMQRAAQIARCFGAHWLASVSQPKQTPDEVVRGQRLLDTLHGLARQSGSLMPSWREADILVLAPNFGWSRAEMKSAITSICGHGLAQIVPRIENGRRVIKLELMARNFTSSYLTCSPAPARS